MKEQLNLLLSKIHSLQGEIYDSVSSIEDNEDIELADRLDIADKIANAGLVMEESMESLKDAIKELDKKT